MGKKCSDGVGQKEIKEEKDTWRGDDARPDCISDSGQDNYDASNMKHVPDTKKEEASEGSLAKRYLAAVNSDPRGNVKMSSSNTHVKLTYSGQTVPSVRQTQKLLLIKTGQADD